MTSELSAGVRTAKQARSHATHDAILEAALAEIREKGPDDFTLADVVKRAKCTTGAVYARFRSKEALLFALYQSVVEQWEDELRRGFAAAAAEAGKRSLRDDLLQLFASQVSARRKDWSLRNAFLARIVSQSDFRRVSAGMMRVSADLLAEYLSMRREFKSVARQEMKRRTGLVTVVIGAAIERAISFRSEAAGFLPATDKELVSELCNVALTLLKKA